METLENRLQKRIHVSLYALLFLTALLGLSVLLEGCTDRCEVTREYVYYEPVYTTVEEIRNEISLLPAQPVSSVGALYFKDDILYVNEPGKGIHIVNNTDPANPVILKFLNIPGNYDLAIKGNTLYADSYVDLVAFDISDISDIHEVNRVEGVFQNYRVMGYAIDPECCVITDFAEKKVVQVTESDCSSSHQDGGIFYERGIAVPLEMAANFNSMAAIAPGHGSGPGVGGSMARFTISGNYLYLLDGDDVQTVNISDEADPVVKTRTELAWDIETIFPYKSSLFIGSGSGMHILDISTPESPVRISTYEHIRSCDPVVVDESYAYVTLRSGTTCQGFANQLEVIDISNLRAPELIKTYAMTNPHGLGIDDNTLFICDGSDGLKAFDASDVYQIGASQLAHYKDIHAVDVIPFDNILMMIGEDGIFQFDYRNPKDLRLLSKIPIAHAL